MKKRIIVIVIFGMLLGAITGALIEGRLRIKATETRLEIIAETITKIQSEMP